MVCKLYPALLMSLMMAVSCHSQDDVDSAKAWRFGISGGMGVTLIRATDIVDYVRTVSASPTRDDFGVAAEFFGAMEFRPRGPWGIKVEYCYLLRSEPIESGGVQNISLTYGIHMPEVMVQYYVIGKGYLLKVGGGVGYHIAAIDEDYASLGTITYRSTGIGLITEAEANTEFDDHLFGLISLDIRGDFMTELKDSNGMPLVIRNSGKHVTMSFLGLGVKFGLVYYF